MSNQSVETQIGVTDRENGKKAVAFQIVARNMHMNVIYTADEAEVIASALIESAREARGRLISIT